MKSSNAIGAVVLSLLLLSGCASLQQASVEGRRISNPSLGLYGITFDIPQGFELYQPDAAGDYNELQQTAIRIYELNDSYHPRGDEWFYEGFLLMSDDVCLLLMTVKYEVHVQFDEMLSPERMSWSQELLPLYNVSHSEIFQHGRSRSDVLYVRGQAYESKGWVYPDAGKKRNRFSYEAFKGVGMGQSGQDGYLLAGLAAPGSEELLAASMQRALQALQF